MKITNTLDYARDIVIDGGFITVDAGATVDLSDHLPAGDAQKLGRSLNEQDGWTPIAPKKAAAKKRTKTAPAAPETLPVADATPAEPANEENV